MSNKENQSGLQNEKVERTVSFVRSEKVDQRSFAPKSTLKKSKRGQTLTSKKRLSLHGAWDGVTSFLQTNFGIANASPQDAQVEKSVRTSVKRHDIVVKPESTVGSFVHLNLFHGKWVSKNADGVFSFLEELEVGEKFLKLAAKYAGSQKATLEILQKQNSFEIKSSNARRDVIWKFDIGQPFVAENEKGQVLECCAKWEDRQEGQILSIDAVNKTTKKHVIVRRIVTPNGNLEEIIKVVGGSTVSTRCYKKVRASVHVNVEAA